MHLEVKKKEGYFFLFYRSYSFHSSFCRRNYIQTRNMSGRHQRNLSASLYVRGLAEKVR